jgi:hypothetical protein
MKIIIIIITTATVMITLIVYVKLPTCRYHAAQLKVRENMAKDAEAGRNVGLTSETELATLSQPLF